MMKTKFIIPEIMSVLFCVMFSFSFGIKNLHANETTVMESLIKTTPCADHNQCTFTFTLASYLGVGLNLAQDKIGKRDQSFTLLGYEFTSEESPTFWFPGNNNNVVIQLTQDAMHDKKKALFQLGHEIIHIISPKPGVVNILEEGLATEFSLEFVSRMGFTITEDYIASKKYLMAFDAVQCLRKFQPSLNKKLKDLRLSGHDFGHITVKDLQHYLSKTPVTLLMFITRPFPDINTYEKEFNSECSTHF